MKFAALELLVLGAGLAAATPLRVIMVSTHSEVSSNLRFGMPVAHVHANHNVAQIMNPGHNLITEAGPHDENGARRRPSCRFRQKAVTLSNTFRKALGLPLIHGHPQSGTEIHGGVIRIMPFIGTPSSIPEHSIETSAVPPHGHHGQFHQRLRDSSFLTRLHYSLAALGPWEGRAVAFVLGCGIGVLLRMFWVLAIISYRSIRGNKEDENEYAHIVEYEDAEEIFVAPPNYVLADEKIAAPEEIKAAPTSA